MTRKSKMKTFKTLQEAVEYYEDNPESLLEVVEVEGVQTDGLDLAWGMAM